MSNTIGENLKLTLFGESHGDYIGATLDGITPGLKIDYDYIKDIMAKRKPKSYETGRIEEDKVEFISGIFNGYTTGEPLTVIIKNENTKSNDYELLKDNPRPSHADYTKYVFSDGYNDYRGGGHASARLTAPIVALGGVLLKALEDKGIYIASYIKSIGDIDGGCLPLNPEVSDIQKLNQMDFPVIGDSSRMEKLIEKVKSEGDSVGGTIETVVLGLKAGLGSPYFSSVESKISEAMFSIPGVKGIEFGLGFNFAKSYGSKANDGFYMLNDEVKTKTNNNGGINGGLTNSMPLVFRLALRPTASIFKPLETINLKEKKDTVITLSGRHDPCIVRRASVIVRSLTAFVIADMLLKEEGRRALK